MATRADVLTDARYRRLLRAAWAVTRYSIHDPKYETWHKLCAAVDELMGDSPSTGELIAQLHREFAPVGRLQGPFSA